MSLKSRLRLFDPEERLEMEAETQGWYTPTAATENGIHYEELLVRKDRLLSPALSPSALC